MRQSAMAIVRVLVQAGHVAYFVGGCVRDRLLGYPIKDIDIATSANPTAIQELFPQAFGVGAAFGVFLVRINGISFEVATFRTDGAYRDSRHPETIIFSTAQEDANRRDFTVNGLFEDPLCHDKKQALHDYVNGVTDIKQRILRCIGVPAQRFEEDALRLMRAVRFAITKNLQIERNTLQAMTDHAELLARIAPERIQDELNKILLAPERLNGIKLLIQTGLMRHIVPELYAMLGCTQPPQWHPEGDVYEHTLLMFDILRQEIPEPPLELVLAILLHDVGKPVCRQVDAKGNIRFRHHDKIGAELTHKILRRLKYPNVVVKTVVHMVERHMQFMNVQQMRTATLRRFMNTPYFEYELILHRVDCRASNKILDNWHFLTDNLKRLGQEKPVPPSLMTGRDLIELGLRPGTQFKTLLQMILDLQMEGTITTKQEALEHLIQIVPIDQNTLADYRRKYAL